MENYASVTPISPPRSFQEHDASLGSSLASPAHPYQHSLQSRREHQDTIKQRPASATTCGDEVGNEQNSSDFPSPAQQAALSTLQDYDNQTIFAWLTGFRSFKPGGDNWFQPACLSPQQLKAISALEDYTDNLISVWLDTVRCSGSFHALHNYYDSSYLAVQRAALTSTRNTWRGSSNTSRSSSSSFGPSVSPYDSCTSPSTQRSSWSRGTFLDLSREPSIDETTASLPFAGAHTHWCFVCENPRGVTTCDGWKRHMKEHETRYPCMPQGRERYTAHGPECVLCGVLNPDERHYDSHKILPCCSNQTLVTRSYTRKSHLISHLKTHDVADGSALAEGWRDTLDKKYFSCGFCITCFHSHTDQLNHIDSAHYKKHQHIREWDSDKVIRGLLLQPGVQESWRNILAVHSQYIGSGFRWSPATAKSLQLRLEKREETANNLALAAFNESTYDWIQNTQLDSMPVAGFSNQDLSIHHNLPIIQPQATLAQMHVTPNQSSVYNGGMMNTAFQAQNPAWGSIATSHFSPGAVNANPTAYRNNSSRELMMTDRAQRDMELGLPSCSSNAWAPPQLPSHVPCDGSTSAHSDACDGQTAVSSSLTADGNWHAYSSPKPLVGQSGHQQNTSAGRTRTIAATQPTSSGFSCPASPLTPAISFPRRNDSSSLLATPTKQPSRTKLKDHYDIDTEADMDINLDHIQYFMREEGHTRSEKRRR